MMAYLSHASSLREETGNLGACYPKESFVLDSTSFSSSEFKNTGTTGGVGVGEARDT